MPNEEGGLGLAIEQNHRPFWAGGNYANTAIEVRTHPSDPDRKHYFANFDFDVGVE
jgi:hypothetical protein